MDPKEAENQKKMKALTAYIEQQLSTGTHPKDLYTDLIGRKVPHKLAIEMIDQQRGNQKAPGSTPPAPESANPTREDRIREFINTQAEAGKTVNQILDMLLERNVTPQEAADLILTETGLAVSLPDNGLQVAATLQREQVPATMPSIGNLRQMTAYLSGQLANGVKPKDLVESLVQNGMSHNAAIDAVMNAKQKLELEIKEIAASSEGITKADQRKRGLRNMLIGGALFFGGLCITLVSYMSTEAGGTYWLFYGPVIYGLISGIMGLVQFLRSG